MLITLLQEGERKISICILGQKVNVKTELCQYFGSDRITLVDINVQFSYFIHRCGMV